MQHMYSGLEKNVCVCVQASSKEAMSYWLDQLQSRRRKFSKRRKKNSCTDKVVSE